MSRDLAFGFEISRLRLEMTSFRDFSEALKLPHTLFALPFAYLGLWSAAGQPAWTTVGWVTLAMIGARTAGMSLNRLIDLPIDKQNPRTGAWPVPSGKIKPVQLGLLAAASVVLLLYAAAALNPLCFKLAPVAILLFTGYPWLKRFTWACHLGLGLVLAAAPIGGWLAVTGAWDLKVLPLGTGVFFWVVGFDIIYALLDLDFDSRHGVYSIPRRFGEKGAILISRLCHALAAASFAGFGWMMGFQHWYWVGVALVAILLFYEHRLVVPGQSGKIQKAFFTVNSWVSVTLFLFTLLEVRTYS